MQNDSAENRDKFSEDDIFFECPRCGKSMGIAKEGEGMVVKCLECGLDIKVPSHGEKAEHAEEATAPEDTAEAEEEKPSHFDAEYVINKEQRDLIFDEVATIQRSLDRIVAALDTSR